MNKVILSYSKLKNYIMKTHFKLFLLLTLFLVFSCSDKVIEKPFISPPFADLNPQYSDYNFDASTGDTIFIASGTEIIIPADIWVNENGEKINGNINLKYRELSDAIGIFLAGLGVFFAGCAFLWWCSLYKKK